MRPPKVARPTPVPRVRSALLDRLVPADVPMFWERIATRLPLVEDDGGEHVVVTFCWRDARATQVLLFANRLTDETSLADTMLERLPGTDLWHASFRMGRGWRASYSFLVAEPGREPPWVAEGQVALRAALDHGRRDPLNPDTCRNRIGVIQSVASMPDAPPQQWLMPRPGVPEGTLDEAEGPHGRAVWCYQPAGTDPEEPLPLVVALDGEVWTRWLPTTLDNLIAAAEVPPVRALLISSGGRDARWRELGSGGSGVAYVVDELLPWAQERTASTSVVIAGQSLGGLTALRAGLSRPDRIAAVISHSASLWQDDLADVLRPSLSLRVYLAHGLQEWVLAGPHRDLARRLRQAEIEVAEAPYDGGHDYACWRGDLAEGLRWVWAAAPADGGRAAPAP